MRAVVQRVAEAAVGALQVLVAAVGRDTALAIRGLPEAQVDLAIRYDQLYGLDEPRTRKPS